MTNPNTSTFIKLSSKDNNGNTVEFLIHKDRVAYIIDGNVFLKGDKSTITLSLEFGDMKLTDLKLPEKQGETYDVDLAASYELSGI